MQLAIEPLTRDAFAPFGDVIEVAADHLSFPINAGTSQRFHDLARLDQIYRIAAFFVVAIVALAASFLFARFLRANPESKP